MYTNYYKRDLSGMKRNKACFIISSLADSDDIPELVALAYSVTVLYLLCVPVLEDIQTEQTGCIAFRKKNVP